VDAKFGSGRFRHIRFIAVPEKKACSNIELDRQAWFVYRSLLFALSRTGAMGMPNRKASAVWEGGLKGGTGTFRAESGNISGNYSFSSRFEEGAGSNPEELLAAAHAACFSMALSAQLEGNGTPPTRVETNAVCTVEKAGAGFKITTMRLTTRATVPNIDDAKFQQVANAALEGCPVSQALKGNVKFVMDASLT
jgi:osmotically inducible protein OsmC